MYKNLKSSNLIFGLIIYLIFVCTCNTQEQNLHIKKFNINIKEKEIITETDHTNIFKFTNSNNNIDTYIFDTSSINEIVGYSGKPIDLLISLSTDGIINDLKLIKHSEPIISYGVPIEKLLEAIAFYKGQNIKKSNIVIGKNSAGDLSVPIIAGATVTSFALHETILNTSRNVAKKLNIIPQENDQYIGFKKISDEFDWDNLLEINAIKHYRLDDLDNNLDDPAFDLYFADIKHPAIGKNLLGETEYNKLFKKLYDYQSAIIILNNGTYSFKGSGFVRGTKYERFRIEQDGMIFSFKSSSFRHVYDLNNIDVSDFAEHGIFIIDSSGYVPWKPWDLVLLVGNKNINITYTLPTMFCEKAQDPMVNIWKSNIFNLTIFVSIWFLVMLIFIFKYLLVKNHFVLSMTYNIILLMDIYLIGIMLKAQLSIVNILSITANISISSIKSFLLEPCIFIGWIMALLFTIIWGKGFFCGWICPFGALQEVIFRFKSLYSDKSIEFKIFDKIKYLRYIILFILIVVSFKSFTIAKHLAEIEPFKNVWLIGIFNRNIYAISYTLGLIILSFFTYRFFCRLLCPLGAFFSALSMINIIKLKRRNTCAVCKICMHSCNSNAIDKKGNIDSKECFACFSCIKNMYNHDLCPPIKNKKIRDKYEKDFFI